MVVALAIVSPLAIEFFVPGSLFLVQVEEEITGHGRVVQIGTPEELVLNPADEYVAEFTHNVTKAKVVRVRTIMKPLPGRAPKGGYGGTVLVGDTVAEVAPLVENSKKTLRVVDEQGEIVGCLSRDDVVAVMMQA